MPATKKTLLISVISCVAMLGGCASRTENVNPIAEGEKEKPLSFATYAATREYPADAEKATAPVAAEVDYQLDVINLVNLGDTALDGVEVWVNEHYVVLLGSLPVKRQRGVNFGVLFDKAGQRSPSRGTWVNKVELYYDGKLHPLTVRLAD